MIGKPIYYAGTSGTVTLGSGEWIHILSVHSATAGSFTIFGGPSIAVVGGAGAPPFIFQFYHTLYKAPFDNGSSALVFTGTDHYFVHTIRQGNV